VSSDVLLSLYGKLIIKFGKYTSLPYFSPNAFKDMKSQFEIVSVMQYCGCQYLAMPVSCSFFVLQSTC
jgi:hypothetical protein